MARIHLPGQHTTRQSFLGWIAVFCSAFCLYLATAIIRWADPRTDIATSYFVFARFLLGFIVASSSMLIRKEFFKPGKTTILSMNHSVPVPGISPRPTAIKE